MARLWCLGTEKALLAPNWARRRHLHNSLIGFHPNYLQLMRIRHNWIEENFNHFTKGLFIATMPNLIVLPLCKRNWRIVELWNEFGYASPYWFTYLDQNGNLCVRRKECVRKRNVSKNIALSAWQLRRYSGKNAYWLNAFAKVFEQVVLKLWYNLAQINKQFIQMKMPTNDCHRKRFVTKCVGVEDMASSINFKIDFKHILRSLAVASEAFPFELE